MFETCKIFFLHKQFFRSNNGTLSRENGTYDRRSTMRRRQQEAADYATEPNNFNDNLKRFQQTPTPVQNGISNKIPERDRDSPQTITPSWRRAHEIETKANGNYYNGDYNGYSKHEEPIISEKNINSYSPYDKKPVNNRPPPPIEIPKEPEQIEEKENFVVSKKTEKVKKSCS